MTDKNALALEALRSIKATLDHENEQPDGVIEDTIWHGPGETLFDFIENTIAALESAAPSAAEPVAIPDHRVADVGFRWDCDAQHHVPQVLIEFDPVPGNGPCDAKGWRDRNALVAFLSAPPTPSATSAESIEGDMSLYHRVRTKSYEEDLKGVKLVPVERRGAPTVMDEKGQGTLDRAIAFMTCIHGCGYQAFWETDQGKRPTPNHKMLGEIISDLETLRATLPAVQPEAETSAERAAYTPNEIYGAWRAVGCDLAVSWDDFVKALPVRADAPVAEPVAQIVAYEPPGYVGGGLSCDRRAEFLSDVQTIPIGAQLFVAPDPRFVRLIKAAIDLIAAVDENLDTKEVPLKYTVPWGAVVNLRNCLDGSRPPAPEEGKDAAQEWRARVVDAAWATTWTRWTAGMPPAKTPEGWEVETRAALSQGGGA